MEMRRAKAFLLKGRHCCALKDFGLAFKIHEGPVKPYVSQYTERNNTDFTFKDEKKHRTPIWKILEHIFPPSLLITVANHYFNLGRIMQRKITGELLSRN